MDTPSSQLWRSFMLKIVSVESAVFSGLIRKLFVSGTLGDLEVLYGHTPLLTKLKPGPLWILTEAGEEEVFYISGGTLEVAGTLNVGRPLYTQGTVTVLADLAIRPKNVNAIEASAAKQRAEEILEGRSKDFNYAAVHTQLLDAVMQLKELKKFREFRKH